MCEHNQHRNTHQTLPCFRACQEVQENQAPPKSSSTRQATLQAAAGWAKHVSRQGSQSQQPGLQRGQQAGRPAADASSSSSSSNGGSIWGVGWGAGGAPPHSHINRQLPVGRSTDLPRWHTQDSQTHGTCRNLTHCHAQDTPHILAHTQDTHTLAHPEHPNIETREDSRACPTHPHPPRPPACPPARPPARPPAQNHTHEIASSDS